MSEKSVRGKDKKNLNLTIEGMLITALLFSLMMLALYYVQSSVPYTMREESIQILPKEEVQGALDIQKREEVRYVVMEEQNDQASRNAMGVIVPILDQMKIPYDVVSAQDFRSEQLQEYECLILAVNHYADIAAMIGELKTWVKQGGKLMVLFPPDYSGNFMAMFDILGIKDCGLPVEINEVRFRDGFMIGGDDRSYPITDAYASSYALTVSEDSTVCMESTDKYPIPLIWRRSCGEGTVVFDNFGIMEKAYRGIHSAALSLLEDSFVYPVINAATFYIDDFPAPVPEGDGEYITRDYNMSVSDFYSQVWWNDVYNLAKKYGIKYTGVVIEEYNSQVEGELLRNEEVDRYLYFGNMLLQTGGEIGIHGYNHMPLVLSNFDYENQYDSYKQWASMESLTDSVTEVMEFTQALFPGQKLQVYVPPSNILSEEGRSVLEQAGIRAIASVYLEGDLAYEQEFEVSREDGIVNTPRVIAGYIFNDYVNLVALCELNFHLVSTHFQHPDDVLDEDRGAQMGWEMMKTNLGDYMEWLYNAFPEIRNLTGSELAGAVERYDLLQMKRTKTDTGFRLELENFFGEANMLLRLNEGQTLESISGGSWLQITDTCYLITCTQDQVDIVLK